MTTTGLGAAPSPGTGAVAIGVDLGGTKTAAGLVLPGGHGELVCTAPTPAGAGPTAIIATVTALITQIRDKAQRSGLPAAQAIGIGAAGVIDLALPASTCPGPEGPAGQEPAAGWSRRDAQRS